MSCSTCTPLANIRIDCTQERKAMCWLLSPWLRSYRNYLQLLFCGTVRESLVLCVILLHFHTVEGWNNNQHGFACHSHVSLSLSLFKIRYQMPPLLAPCHPSLPWRWGHRVEVMVGRYHLAPMTSHRPLHTACKRILSSCSLFRGRSSLTSLLDHITPSSISRRSRIYQNSN